MIRASFIGWLLLLLCSGFSHGGENPSRTLKDLVLFDQLGDKHDVGAESVNHLAMVFDIELRSLAKRWDDGLSGYLPKDRPLIRLLDGSAIALEDRSKLTARIIKALDGSDVRFLFDWDGVVRKRLGLSSGHVWIVSFADDGTVAGEHEGQANAAGITSGLKLIGIVPDPPIRDVLSSPKGGSSR